MLPSHITQALADGGIAEAHVLDESGHFHVEGPDF